MFRGIIEEKNHASCTMSCFRNGGFAQGVDAYFFYRVSSLALITLTRSDLLVEPLPSLLNVER